MLLSSLVMSLNLVSRSLIYLLEVFDWLAPEILIFDRNFWRSSALIYIFLILRVPFWTVGVSFSSSCDYSFILFLWASSYFSISSFGLRIKPEETVSFAGWIGVILLAAIVFIVPSLNVFVGNVASDDYFTTFSIFYSFSFSTCLTIFIGGRPSGGRLIYSA